MSRYFRFKSIDAFTRAAEEYGLPKPVVSEPSMLLRPLRWAGGTLGNRLVIQPMEGCDGEPDGSPGELTFRRYQRFGAGGAKLIWGEACAVVPEGRANPRQLVINRANQARLARMIETCRNAHRATFGHCDDFVVGLQLTHSGRYSFPRPLLAQHDPLLDPRTRIDGTTVSAQTPLLGDDELARLQDRFVEAAHIAADCGADFVDLKQCHRYLLNELLAAYARPGRFGGSFENRTRFAREVVARIRTEVPNLHVASRLNVFDGVPYAKGQQNLGVAVRPNNPTRSTWGTASDNPELPDLAEPLQLIRMLSELGVAFVNVSMGNPYASPHILRPFEYPPPDGYETPEHPLIGVARHLQLTETVQRAFPDLPVVGSGYSWLQEYILHVGAASVEHGRAALVGIGRAALSQPDFGKRLLDGQPLDPKRTCRTFSYCTALMRSKHNALGQYPTGCPPFDKATYGPIWDEAKSTAQP